MFVNSSVGNVAWMAENPHSWEKRGSTVSRVPIFPCLVVFRITLLARRLALFLGDGKGKYRELW